MGHQPRRGRCRRMIAGRVFMCGVVGACRPDVIVAFKHLDVEQRLIVDAAKGRSPATPLTGQPVGVE